MTTLPTHFRRTLLSLSLLGIPAASAETVVTLSEEVLFQGMPRLGVHASGDNYYDAVNRKARVEENFEGTVNRFIARAIVIAPNVVEPEHSISPEMAQTLINNNATYMITAGPDMFKTGQITSIQILDPAATRTRVRLTLDSAFTPDPKQNGIMVDAFDPRGWITYSTIGNPIGSQVVPNTAMLRGDTTLITTEGAPTFGNNSMRFNGTSAVASYQFFTHYKDQASPNGTWTVRFWHRTQSGSPTFRVGPNEFQSQLQTVPGSNTWTQRTLTFTINGNPEAQQSSFLFTVSGGSVLVDDVEIVQEGSTNPTAFRDDHVAALNFLKPGVVRYLVNRADRIQNRIDRKLRSYSHRTFATISSIDWGMHDFFGLAEHVGFAPWYTLPGTMNPDDVRYLVEYLAGPVTTPGGARRAALGRPAPWTDSLDKIFCQFGNEWITFSGTGFNGKGYWEALIQAAKSSPYYNPKILFVTDSQGGAGWNLDNAPSSDVLCHGGYMNYGIYNSMLAPFTTPESLARFVLTIPWQQWTTPNGSLDNVLAAVARGVMPAVYEGGNFHTTFGDAPVETINDIVTSHVGGLVGVHNMLLLQTLYGCRYQNSFNLSQKSFSPGGSFGDINGSVRLWGGMLSQREDSVRYRPRFLILAAANRAIGGDQIRTVQSGPDAATRFSVTAKYSPSYANRKEADLLTHTIELSPIASYGYRDGSRRGLILINQDTTQARTVRVNFSGNVTSTVQGWRVAPSDAFADNENTATAPQVALETLTLPGFASGSTVTLPATGFLALSWTVDEAPPALALLPATPAAAQVGNSYSTSFSANGGRVPYSFSVSGLPAFFSLNPATGTFTGTPTVSGTFPFTVTVTDGNGDTDSGNFSLTINPAPVGNGQWVEAGGSVVMEAENADVVANGDPVPWSSATAGSVTYRTNGYRSADLATYATGSSLRFLVQISTGGTYSIRIRRRAVDGFADSAFLGLNNTQVGTNQFTGVAADFTWTASVSLGTLTPGLHTIEIRRREAGLEIDRVMLGLSSVSFPSGTAVGPAESTRLGSGTPEPVGFERWRHIHFTPAQLSNTSVSGPLAAPLGDGVANKLKYAAGVLPTTSGLPIEWLPALPDGRQAIRLTRNTAATDVPATIQVSNNLTTWSSSPADYELEVLSTSGDLQTVRVSPPVGSSPTLWFVRLVAP